MQTMLCDLLCLQLVLTATHKAFCTMSIIPCEGMYVINGRGFFELSFPGQIQSQIEYRSVKRQIKKEVAQNQ